MVIEDAALLNRRVTHMTPPHFSAAVYIGHFLKIISHGEQFKAAVFLKQRRQPASAFAATDQPQLEFAFAHGNFFLGADGR